MDPPTLSNATNLRKKLELQRKLALQTISRADDNSKEVVNKNLGISYLLRPNESSIEYQNYTNADALNISEAISNVTDPLENLIDSSTSNVDLTQSVQDILASSCFKGVQDTVSVFDDIRDSENTNELLSNSCGAIESSWGGMQQSILGISNASFKSFNEEVQQRLLSDEQEWRQQFADIPISTNKNDTKLNFSEFSGYLPSMNVSDKVKNNESVASFGEFFQLRSENIDNMIAAGSPSKSKPAKPLLDMNEKSMSNIYKSEINKKLYEADKIPYNETAVATNESVASLSAIGRVLNMIQDQDSPQTIINTMFKKTSKLPVNNQNNDIVQETNKKPNVFPDNSIICGSITSKSNKENSDPNICCASSSTMNSTADFVALSENFATDVDLIPDAETNLNIGNITRDKIEDFANLPVSGTVAGKPQGNSCSITINDSVVDQKYEDYWIQPKAILNHNHPTSDVSKSTTTKNNEIHLDAKFEESVIITQVDDNLKELEIEVEENVIETYPLWSSYYIPVKIQSKADRTLFINAKFIKLIFNNTQEISNGNDFIKIELPVEPVSIEPQMSNVLIVKISGLEVGTFNITLLLEDFDAHLKMKKTTTHMFQINFVKPSIRVFFSDTMVPVETIDFGKIPMNSSKCIDLRILNKCKTILPLALKLRSSANEPFSIMSNEFDSQYVCEKLEDCFDLREFTLSTINFNSKDIDMENKMRSEHKTVLDLCLRVDKDFILLKSYYVIGVICHSNILFHKQIYPLHLEYSETKPVHLRNNGFIDLTYDVYIGKSGEDYNYCNDEIFSLSQSRFTVKQGEEYQLQVTLNRELLNSTERVIVFKQTLNGPIHSWPIVAKSRSVQSYLRTLSPTRVLQKFTKNSVSPKNDKLKLNPNVVTPNRLSPKSSRSSCASSSTKSENISPSSANSKLPIKAMKAKMSWPSVKLGKSTSQDVTIKNTSEHRVKIHMNVGTEGFSLVKNNDCSKSMTLVLQGLEVHSLTIVFSPQRVGPHLGNLVFIDSRTKAKSMIPLVAFGGRSDVSITGVFKHPNGTNFLPLGESKGLQAMHATIQLHNKGNVDAFIHIVSEGLKNKFVLSSSEIVINPDIMIIHPNTSKSVEISFKPKKDYVSRAKNDVLELTTLSVMSGDEGLRQRTRILYEQDPYHRSDPVWKRLLPLFTKVAEEPYYPEFDNIREPASALHDILASLDVKEICITIEKHSNHNSDMSIITIDESVMFQSLCTDLENSVILSWTFEPNKIVISVPTDMRKSIRLTSHYKTRQNFEISSHPLLKIKPMSGTVVACGTVELIISYVGGVIRKNQSTMLQFLVENDVVNIPVDILCS